MQNSGETSFSGKMGMLTVDEQVLAALTEIAAKEGIGLDELLGDFVKNGQALETDLKLVNTHTVDLSFANRDLVFEIRSVLASIRGTTDYLKRNIWKHSETRINKAIDDLVFDVKRFQEFIQEITDHANVQSGKFPIELEPTDINHLIREFIESFPANEQKIELKLEIEENLPSIIADKYRLRQVLHSFVEKGTYTYPRQAILRAKAAAQEVHLEIYYLRGKMEEGKALLERRVEKYILEKHNAPATLNQEGNGVNITITLPISTLER